MPQSTVALCSVAPLSHGILQARILQWVAISFSDQGWDLPDPGMAPVSPALQADGLPAEPRGKPRVRVRVNVYRMLLLCQALK